MSTSIEAKLFYGYVKLVEEDYDFDDDDEKEDTPWDTAHTNKAHGCIGGIYGTDGNLGNFLAVESALYKAEWSTVKSLSPQDFEIQPEWDEQLQQAAAHFGIDVSELKPGWHLVSLYF
jgi:hypothetical protein